MANGETLGEMNFYSRAIRPHCLKENNIRADNLSEAQTVSGVDTDFTTRTTPQVHDNIQNFISLAEKTQIFSYVWWYAYANNSIVLPQAIDHRRDSNMFEIHAVGIVAVEQTSDIGEGECGVLCKKKQL